MQSVLNINPYETIITSKDTLMRVAAIALSVNLFLTTPLTAHPIISTLEKAMSVKSKVTKNTIRFLIITSAFAFGWVI